MDPTRETLRLFASQGDKKTTFSQKKIDNDPTEHPISMTICKKVLKALGKIEILIIQEKLSQTMTPYRSIPLGCIQGNDSNSNSTNGTLR